MTKNEEEFKIYFLLFIPQLFILYKFIRILNMNKEKKINKIKS